MSRGTCHLSLFSPKPSHSRHAHGKARLLFPKRPLHQLAGDELWAVAAACWSHFLPLQSGLGSGSLPGPSSVFVLGLRRSQGSGALFSSRQYPRWRLSSDLSLARRRRGLRVTRWFLRALHALASFLLAQGIALSERKVLRAEWSLPENALLFRVRRMGVGVGQKLKATVGRADGTRTSGRRRERYASSQRGWGIRRPTKGQRPSISGPQGTCTRGDRAARPKCLCRDPGFGRVAGAPRGAGRKPRSLSAPGAILATVAREPREGGSIAAGRACGNWGAEVSRLSRPARLTLGNPDPRERGT